MGKLKALGQERLILDELGKINYVRQIAALEALSEWDWDRDEENIVVVAKLLGSNQMELKHKLLNF